MTSFGFSPSDILGFLRQVQKFVNTYRHAGEELKDFADLLSEWATCLEALEKTLELANKPTCRSFTTFKSTLSDGEKMLKRYQALWKEDSNMAKKSLGAVDYRMNEQEIRDLKARTQRHISTIQLYSQQITLELFVSAIHKIETLAQNQDTDRVLRKIFKKLENPRPSTHSASNEVAVSNPPETSGPDILDPTFVLARLQMVLPNNGPVAGIRGHVMEVNDEQIVLQPSPLAPARLLLEGNEGGSREILGEIKDLINRLRSRLQNHREFRPEHLREMSRLAERAAELLELPPDVSIDEDDHSVRSVAEDNPGAPPVQIAPRRKLTFKGGPVEIVGVDKLYDPTPCTLDISSGPEWISIRAVVDSTSQTFRHDFRREERPFPHTNHPGKGTSSSYFVSFFSEQSVVEENVNSGKGLCANLQYIFSSRSDRKLFQQELFGQTLLKEVGIDKLKSSGGRLECEIEELRLWEDNAGQKSIIYYASAEKKEKHRKYRHYTVLKVMERNPVILRVSPYSAPLEMLPLPTMVGPEYLTSASDSATSLSPTETSQANENFNELLRAQTSSFSSFSLGRTTPNSPPAGNRVISAYDQMNTTTPSPINTGSQTSPSIPAVSRKNSVASITSSLFHPFRSRRASSVTSISSTETASTSTSDKPNEITIDFTSQEDRKEFLRILDSNS